jgi:transcriptional regulator with XRE-family HTH domain
MKKKKKLTAFEISVIGRVREARTATGLNQDKMAEALGIARPTYAKYELDRIIAIELLPAFCEITNTSIEFILTGKAHPVLTAYYSLDPSSKERLAVDQFLQIDKDIPETDIVSKKVVT